MKNLKKWIVSLALAGGFILSAGAFTDAHAQDWRWNRNRRVEHRRDRNRDGIPDRFETRRGQPDFNRNGVPDQYERNWRNRNNVRGYYDRFGRFHRY